MPVIILFVLISDHAIPPGKESISHILTHITVALCTGCANVRRGV